MNEKPPIITTENHEMNEHTPNMRATLSRAARVTAQRAIAAYSQLKQNFHRDPTYIYIDDDEPNSTISDETYAALMAAGIKETQ